MKTSLWTSLKSFIFNQKDRSTSSAKNKANTNALSDKLNVNEEYKQAFRTNSYIEFTTTNKDNNTSSFSSSSLPSCLLDPDQELLKDTFESSHGRHRIHRLLFDYFEASFEAFKTCQLLLQALHQTRINHAIVNRVIKLTTGALMADDEDNIQGYNNNNNGLVYKELLSSFSQLKTPFSILIHDRFLALHDTHSNLIRKLSIKRSETRKKLRLKKIWKKVAKACFVMSNTVVIVAILVLALHSLVGVVAAPGLIVCSVGLLKKKRRGHNNKLASSELVLHQMEIASRATYITMNDLDTLSRMAARLDGEVEHLKVVGEMWMRSSRRRKILKEAVKELVVEDDAIVEQMKELQQHIYLCFLTINRSRRLVVNEIMGVN